MIVAEDLEVTLDDRRVLHGVDLVVRRGERLGLLGRSPAGRTTLLRVLAGLIAPSGGRVAVDGRDPWRQRETLARRFCLTNGPLPAAVTCDLVLVDDADPACLTLRPGQTVVAALPDAAAAQAVGCDRVAVLAGGRLLAHGALADPAVRAALDSIASPVRLHSSRKASAKHPWRP